MGLEQTNQIDHVGINRDTGNVILSIFDEFDWRDEGSHLRLLQEKLNTYLAYVETEQLYEGNPELRSKQVDIFVYARFPYSSEGDKFLGLASQAISEAGYGFMWNYLLDEEELEQPSN